MSVTHDLPREAPPAENGTSVARRLRGLSDLGLLAPAALTVIMFVVIPLIVVIRTSFAHAGAYGGIEGGWTLENYRELYDPVYLKVLTYSLYLATANTIICGLVGYFVAYYIATKSARVQSMLLLLIIVPFWTDFLVRVFAWINLLSPGGPISSFLDVFGWHHATDGWIPSTGAVFLGLLYIFLPTAVFPIYASMRQLDMSLTEAAADLGCGWFGIHRRVLLPLVQPGLIGAALLTFIPSLGVFVIPVLLGGGKNQLIGNVIVTLNTEYRNQPMGAAASAMLLALMAVALLALGALARRARRKAAPR
ncbi:ABC transporter permease [Streptomyces sp. NPDC091280]|uniref:ABC transporter permease n=1 Tax=Streptomyces sp. NPDC091280 TaxID=3365984 RepID=UPI00381391CE